MLFFLSTVYNQLHTVKKIKELLMKLFKPAIQKRRKKKLHDIIVFWIIIQSSLAIDSKAPPGQEQYGLSRLTVEPGSGNGQDVETSPWSRGAWWSNHTPGNGDVTEGFAITTRGWGVQQNIELDTYSAILCLGTFRSWIITEKSGS